MKFCTTPCFRWQIKGIAQNVKNATLQLNLLDNIHPKYKQSIYVKSQLNMLFPDIPYFVLEMQSRAPDITLIQRHRQTERDLSEKIVKSY